jgi:hypothetical protein
MQKAAVLTISMMNNLKLADMVICAANNSVSVGRMEKLYTSWDSTMNMF